MGNLRYWEVVRHENPQYFFNHCGMTKPVFLLLLRKLTSDMGQLCDGTKISAGQKNMIFLSIIRGNTYRDTSWRCCFLIDILIFVFVLEVDIQYIHPHSKNENENHEPYLACDLEQTYLIYGSLLLDQSHIYSAEGIFRLRVEGKYRSWRQLWPQLWE